MSTLSLQWGPRTKASSKNALAKHTGQEGCFFPIHLEGEGVDSTSHSLRCSFHRPSPLPTNGETAHHNNQTNRRVLYLPGSKDGEGGEVSPHSIWCNGSSDRSPDHGKAFASARAAQLGPTRPASHILEGEDRLATRSRTPGRKSSCTDSIGHWQPANSRTGEKPSTCFELPFTGSWTPAFSPHPHHS